MQIASTIMWKMVEITPLLIRFHQKDNFLYNYKELPKVNIIKNISKFTTVQNCPIWYNILQ